MYLSRLEIFGFKSFAQRTVVNFNQGVTSIVGPNGCGKTNIVDAIRWSLGEQRSGALRSDKMENVIFNGTSSKKPMGMSEVSLTIQNNKGILPTEYSEVVITRRIFRSGESEYLLNKNLCRLKDITNLFMDTGMGSNAYSVIELKMVENILSNKTEERRVLFEEAAGVNKYKLRRRLALKKLDEVKGDLTRVNDIVSEVEKKVASLERQAKKADKYNKVTTTLREIELDLANHEYALYARKSENAKEKKQQNFQHRIEVDSDINRNEEELKQIREKLNVIEAQLKEKRKEISAVVEKIYKSEQVISVNEEKNTSLTRNIERYKRELDELHHQLEENTELVEDSEAILDDIVRKISSKSADKEKAQADVEAFKVDFEEKKKVLKEKSDTLFEKFKVINSKENDFKNVEKSLTAKNNTINKLNDRIQNLTTKIAKTVGFIEELYCEKEGINKKLQDAEAYYLQKEKEKEDLEKELNGYKQKELEQKSLLNGIKDKIQFIQNLIDNLEGVSKGAKILLESNDWALGDKTLLAHIGNSSDEYRLAVEAALKNNLNNILVESFEDLLNGIHYLNSNEAGKATFYLNSFNETEKKTFVQKLDSYFEKKKMKKIQKEEGFTGWVRDFIITDDKWKNIFHKIVKNIAIVNNFETAISLAKKYPSFNFVTPTGDLITSEGFIEAGSIPKLDDSIFGRKKLLEDLKDEFPVRERKIADIQTKIAETEEKLNQIDLKDLSEQGKILVNDIANLDKQIAQFEFEQSKSVDETETVRKELQNNANDSNRLDNEKQQLQEVLVSLSQEKEILEKEKDTLEANNKELESNYSSIVANLNKLNVDVERLNGEKRNTENSIKRAQDSIVQINKSIEKRESEIKIFEEEVESIVYLLDDKKDEHAKIVEDKVKLQQEEGEIDVVYKEIRRESQQIEGRVSELRKLKEKLSEEIHWAEMEISEANIKINNLKEIIKENYSVALELQEFEDLNTYEFKIKQEEVHQLKQQIKTMGSINLLAYSEYDEEKQRLDFLHKQRDDLLDSERDVVKTIEEINETAKTLFTDTFEKIRANFINIFRGLFNPGDEADLRLEENADPLEGKIEIVAKPKGKRPTSIELLSGGEKTLTAIALLFAIYLVKPSPFCILDEIDAPLDDANIDRFTRIIKDFSKDTQFIVVTHNKRTMEAADTLYGVTMQEEGISKLVSVRFNEELSFVQ